ncbi:hypothetical protein [Thermoactinospora rubra]|uniref:hypothetical protein n=1 Tax=Thermoactinospora rubra TaxID=1088767 RepID=UPI00117EF1E2|nr:hypothetical protein [Thermoactinospora rubra]
MVSRSAAVLATGAGHAVRLVVATLAFAGAYAGLSAYGSADSAPANALTLTTQATTTQATAQATAQATGQVTVTAEPPATPGTITVTSAAAGPCRRTLTARTVLLNPDPDGTALYGWRLSRWSPTAREWRTHVADYAGFGGASETLEWRAVVADNPGWYRIELAVRGGKTLRSDRFQVSC